MEFTLMSSNNVFEIIELVASNDSKNAKIEILRELSEEEPALVRVLKYAYDPLVSFGMLNIDAKPAGEAEFNEDTWSVLQDLYERNLTGSTAKRVVQEMLREMSPESCELFLRILRKDLQCGISVSTINKAIPGCIRKMGYMRCQLMHDVSIDDWEVEKGSYVQLKADGMFLNMIYENCELTFTTRKGFSFPMPETYLDKFKAELSEIEGNFVLHGELLVYRDGVLLTRKEGNGILNSILKGGRLEPDLSLEYVVWDIVPTEVFFGGRTSHTYEVRWANLQILLETMGSELIKPIETYEVFSEKDARAYFKQFLSQVKEGAVWKALKGKWKDGNSAYQIKLKDVREADMRVCGYTPGTGKNANLFGSLLLMTDDGNVSCAASGITDALREQIVREGYWIGQIVTVLFNELIQDKKTGEWSLFLPRSPELRLDKHDTDTLLTLQSQVSEDDPIEL